MTTTTTHPSSEQLADEPVLDTEERDASELPDAGLGKQIAPWAAMGALMVAAGAVRLAQNTTGADAEIAYGTAGVAFTVAVVAATVTRRKLRLGKQQRHRLVAAFYLGAAWLSSVAAYGMSWGAVTCLTMLGAGLSLLWWREHRIGAGVDPHAEIPVLDDEDVLGEDMPPLSESDMFVERWDTNLGRKGKAFAGSRLINPETIKSGYRYTLRLVPGVHTVAQVRNAPEQLRSGLELMPGQDVIVEVHPELPAPAALLTIVTRPPVAKPQIWPGPAAGFDSAKGSVILGPFADGEGCACWRVYTEDSIWGGFLQGAPGSGKSRMIEQIALSCSASTSHPTIIWYGDGQRGDSSPMLVECADYVATSNDAIYNMVLAATKVMQINGVENRAAKRVGFRPTALRPGLLVIVDECHKPLSPKENPLLAAASQKLMSTIAREGRKVGVALILASQSPTLDAFGGAGNDADTLRASLLAGNGVLLRSKTNNAKQVFGVDINPKNFPKLPGYAYLADPDEGARSAPFRGYWVTDELAAYWPGQITWRTLPTRQANMAGKAYAKRHEVAAEQAFADQMLLAMADAGSLDDLEVLEQKMDRAAAGSAAAGVDVIEFGDGHPPVRRVTKFWLEQPAPAAQPAGPALSAGQQKVLDAITAGQASPKEIIAATGYSSSQVYNLLGELGEDGLGLITKAAYGRYQPTARAA